MHTVIPINLKILYISHIFSHLFSSLSPAPFLLLCLSLFSFLPPLFSSQPPPFFLFSLTFSYAVSGSIHEELANSITLRVDLKTRPFFFPNGKKL